MSTPSQNAWPEGCQQGRPLAWCSAFLAPFTLTCHEPTPSTVQLGAQPQPHFLLRLEHKMASKTKIKTRKREDKKGGICAMLESQHSTDGRQCCVTVILCGRLERKCQNRTKQQQQQQQKNPNHPALLVRHISSQNQAVRLRSTEQEERVQGKH